MELIYLVSSLCFATSFVHIICRPLITFFSKPSKEVLQLQKEILLLKKDLAKISMRENYVDYVKLERKIASHEKHIQNRLSMNSHKSLLIKYAVCYGLQAILSICIVVISIVYRYTPVIVFNDLFNFAPFSFLMKFPTGVEGGISVPFWIFVNSFVFSTIVGYLKKLQ